VTKVAVVFPGQGSQYVGMGKALFDASQEAREVFTLAEEASGLPIQRLCFEGPLEELTQTVNLQPAMVAVDLSVWRALKAAGIKPAAVAGHSLGEYPALVTAGALSEADCLKLVSLRGKLMDRDSNANPGAMAAVMGKAPEEVAEICEKAGGVVQPANYNAKAQTVITGKSDDVAAAGKIAKEAGAKVIPLKVSGAWHSPLMQKAGEDMRAALAEVSFSEPVCPHLPNTTGRPTTDAGEIKNELMQQLTSSVRWVQSVEAMIGMGVEAFIEAGPKNVLAGLIKKTSTDVKLYNVEDPESLEKVLAELG
jgi:[acyl-carrier-protein] S-malonyltransferase